MNQTLTIAVSALGLAAAIVVLLIVRRFVRPQLPYIRRRSLLTPAELRFYQSLLLAVPEGVTVFVKVRLMDVIDVPDDAWREFGAPGSGMHVDFVLADSATTQPRMVIELDDRSHSRAEVRQRDAFKNAALAAAGVAVMRGTAAGGYNSEELRDKIAAAFA